MRLRPSSFAMTAVLAAMTAFASISNDMYVPSLPAIGIELHASPETVQLTLSAFLVGFAIGQIFYGPLSDKFGRKPALVGGFAIFLAATAACMTAQSITVLILARALQALGASGPIILARAMVRDLHEGRRAARELSIMASIMGVSPVVAPIVGGVLQERFDWRASFVVVEFLGLTIGAVCMLCLPETLKRRELGPISLGSVARSYRIVWGRPSFRAYTAILTASYSGLFAYISASSFVLQGIYGLSAETFSFAFAACSISFVLGSMTAAHLASRRGLDGSIGLGALALALGGAAQLLLCIWAPGNVFSILGPEMAFTAGVGVLLPHLLAAAMTPFPERAGAASSLLGVIQMSGSAIVGSVLGAFLGRSPLPFAVATAATGLATLALFHGTRDMRRERQAATV
jgi:MFS transporter, DHA1 family, multidrug resistance protein